MADDSVQHITIDTEDGEALEAELVNPPEASGAVVITHPHPTYGGSMYTPVPTTLFNRSQQKGIAALRFNFRGVGRSTGTHDKGRAERLDVAAAIDRLAAEAGDALLLVAGWSFGADVALATQHDRIRGWVCVAAPLAVSPADEMAAGGSVHPKLLLVPEHDQFRTPESASSITEGWTETQVQVIPGTDHFLAGSLGAVGDAFEHFVERLLA